jgi:hypothetical protein
MPTPFRSTAVQTTLSLTGDRCPRGLIILINDTPVAVPTTLFDVVVELVYARLSTQTGYSRISVRNDEQYVRTQICRLRQLIGEALGTSGHTVIETGFGTEYRLAIAPSAITIQKGFFELPALMIPPHIRAFLADRV